MPRLYTRGVFILKRIVGQIYRSLSTYATKRVVGENIFLWVVFVLLRGIQGCYCTTTKLL